MVENDYEYLFVRIFSRFLYFWMTAIHNFVKYFNQFEVSTNNFLLKTKPYLPHVARFCIVQIFIYDAFRKWTKWDAQREIMEDKWNCGWHLSTLFGFYEVLGQLIPAILIMFNKRVGFACGILVSVMVLQLFVYNSSLTFFAFGSLILLFAVNQYEQRAINAGDVALANNEPNPSMLDFSRFSIFGFVFIFDNESFYIKAIGYLIAYIFSKLNEYRFKPKLLCMAIVLLVFGRSLWVNYCWIISTRDNTESDFFQALSLIGGLLLLIAYGPDGICLDNNRRRL